MYFDVPKVVRSPGCDHGHDEESQNGRDMKIDILDYYIRTPEWFRGLSDIYRSTGGLPEPLGGYWASWAQLVEEERRPRGSRVPLPQVRIGQGGGAAPPFPPSLSPPSPSPNPTRKGGSPTPGGSRTPPGAPLLASRLSPPCSFIYGGRGAP